MDDKCLVCDSVFSATDILIEVPGGFVHNKCWNWYVSASIAEADGLKAENVKLQQKIKELEEEIKTLRRFAIQLWSHGDNCATKYLSSDFDHRYDRFKKEKESEVSK